MTVSKIDNNVIRDKKFDTLDIPACVRGGEHRHPPLSRFSHPEPSNTLTQKAAPPAANEGKKCRNNFAARRTFNEAQDRRVYEASGRFKKNAAASEKMNSRASGSYAGYDTSRHIMIKAILARAGSAGNADKQRRKSPPVSNKAAVSRTAAHRNTSLFNQRNIRTAQIQDTRLIQGNRVHNNCASNTRASLGSLTQISAVRNTGAAKTVRKHSSSSRSTNAAKGAKPIHSGPYGHTYKRRKRRSASTLLAAAEFLSRRSAVIGISLCLLLIVAIPIAIFAASAVHGASEPDFELIESSGNNNVLYADLFAAEGINLDMPEKVDIPTSDADSENSMSGSQSDKGGDSNAEKPDDNSGKSDVTDEGGDNNSSGDGSILTEEDHTYSDNTDNIAATSPAEVYTVNFMFYDREPMTCMSSPATLREILAGNGYYLTESDKVYVDVDTVIDSDQTVYIDKIEYGTVSETEPIPFEVETYDVQTIPRGTVETASVGVNGSKETVYTVEYINGAEVSRTEEYSYITAYPQDQIEYRGVGGIVYGDDGTAHSFSYSVNVKATYYNLPGNTATGMPVQDGVIAVDPSLFPLGTCLYVKNEFMDMGVRVCADTGVYGNVIDIWMNENSPYYSQFASQGVFYFTAYVLD